MGRKIGRGERGERMAQRRYFVIPGASKSGTTALFECLKQHPDIYTTEIKEPCYFTTEKPDLIRSDAEYMALYRHMKNEKIAGEASASYLVDPDSAQRIRTLLGEDVRIVIMLRNPADRAYSLWRQLRYLTSAEPLSFQEALSCEKQRLNSPAFLASWPYNVYSFQYFHSGLYAAQVKSYMDAFGRSGVTVVLLEDFAANPQSVVEHIFRFFGVESGFRPTLNKHNRASAPRSAMLEGLLSGPGGSTEWLYRVLPVALRDTIHALVKPLYYLNRQALRPPKIDSVLRADLLERYRPDIERLEKLIRRSLALWYDEKPAG